MNANFQKIKALLERYDIKSVLAYMFVMLFFIALIIVYNSLLYSETRAGITERGKLSAVKAAEEFDNYLSASVDALKLAEFSLETLMLRNATEEEMVGYLTSETHIITHSLVPNTTGLYAYINGEYYDGGGWVPDEDYVPTERPWYVNSIQNRGEITVIDPYLDMQSGNVILTLAKCMNDGKTVVALDITMEDIQDIIERISADNGNTADMLLSSQGTVVAHSDKAELGRNYLDGSGDLGCMIAEKLYSDPENWFELDHGYRHYIVYAEGLRNGWYSVSVVASEEAYRPLNIMMLASAVAIMVTVLILAMVMISIKKKDLVAGHLYTQLESTADIYMSLCDINIPDNSVTAIKNVNPAIEQAVASCDHNMQEIFSGIMQGLPDSPTKQAAIDFCDLSDIDVRMKGTNTLTLEYLSYGDIWVRARYVVSERDDSGKITHLLWMLENINEEKTARDKLSQAAEKLRQQLESAADIYISLCELDILDNSVSAIKNANPAIEKAVSACNHNMQDIFFSIMNGLPESPTKQAAIDFADMATIDERMADTNTITLEYLSYGNIWVRARYVVSERTPEGKVVRVIWMLENIDKERKARDKLTAVADKLRNQMSSIADIYMSVYDFDLTNDTFSAVKDGSGRLAELVSRAGGGSQDVLRDAVRQLTDPSSHEAMLGFVDLSTIAERLAGDETVAMEYLSSDRKWRRGRFIVSERSPEGEPLHVLGLFEDIDKEHREREKLIDMSERAIAASEAKSAFLSNMSHEIRTPINAVLGMNEMVLRECTDSNILAYSENIRTAGTTLLGLINDILDFSKIEAGKMEIIPVDYDLVNVLSDLVNMVRTRAENKGLAIVTDFDPEMPEFLHGDEVRLKQIITNILTNAVKYTEKGSVTFSMSSRKVENDPDRVILRVAVRDTGIGIKQEDMAKLFSEFERIEEKRNRTVEGTGLGMSITTNLLSMMGSSLKVESVYGEGSVFSFELEQGVVKPTPIGSYEKAYKQAMSERRKYREKFTAPEARVLVIDDTHMNIVVFRSLLKQTGVNIDTAESSDEGIVLALKNKYDIIFLDHMMPGKDGIETLNELKNAESNPNADTPVICLTANAISGAREKYLEAGFDDYLTKPIDSAKLEDMMYEYLPEDKKKPAAEPSENEKKQKRALPDFIFNLPEIDVFAGIRNSGSEEIYIRVLATYARMVPPLLKEISGCRGSGDMETLIYKLGTLKSCSRTAGAEWIMCLARKLRDELREGNAEPSDEDFEDLYNRCRWLCMDLAPLAEEEPNM